MRKINLKKWLSIWVQALIVLAIAVAIAAIVYGVVNYVSGRNAATSIAKSIMVEWTLTADDVNSLNSAASKVGFAWDPFWASTNTFTVGRVGVTTKYLASSDSFTNTGDVVKFLNMSWFPNTQTGTVSWVTSEVIMWDLLQ